MALGVVHPVREQPAETAFAEIRAELREIIPAELVDHDHHRELGRLGGKHRRGKEGEKRREEREARDRGHVSGMPEARGEASAALAPGRVIHGGQRFLPAVLPGARLGCSHRCSSFSPRRASTFSPPLAVGIPEPV